MEEQTAEQTAGQTRNTVEDDTHIGAPKEALVEVPSTVGMLERIQVDSEPYFGG
jgi:hypothetical protein